MIIPLECLEQLKCCLCKRLLSRLPIHVSKDEDNQLLSICGRCQVPEDENYLRNAVFENLIKHVQFPCINRQYGCKESLLPENSKQHKLICQYQIKQCKLCEWSGQFFAVIEHYQSRHGNLILKRHAFKLTVEIPHIFTILIHKGTIFSIDCNLDVDTKRVHNTLTQIFSTRSIKRYYGQFTLITINGTILSKRFPGGIDTDENEPKSININLENIFEGNNLTVYGMVIITSDMKKLTFSHLRKQIVDNLPKSESKPAASTTATDSNNQSTSQSLKLICELCRYGCGYASISRIDLNQHYKNCSKKAYYCLFNSKGDNRLRKCEIAFSRKYLIRHIHDMHEAEVRRTSNRLAFVINMLAITKERYCKYLVYPSYSCLLIVGYINGCLLWRVEIAHADDYTNNFTFEIKMVNTDNETRLSYRQSCAELTCNKNYNIDDQPCIWLHFDQIKHFIHNNLLTFSIIVFP